jgi:hypothetical protein
MSRGPHLSAGGAVLGIDVGWSLRGATTGLCLVQWRDGVVTWTFGRARHDKEHRRAAIAALLAPAGGELGAVAVDGPLRPDLDCRCTYRVCDALLSRGAFQRRGKVAPTNCPSGFRLHQEAALLAELALEHPVAAARHRRAIHARAVVEAFPNLCLGVMCDDEDRAPYPRPAQRRHWTDTLYPRLAERAKLDVLMDLLLPGHRVAGAWGAVTHHEDRAALACAVTALGLAVGRYVAVGAADGWVVLPAAEAWGGGGGGAWAERALRENVATVARDFPETRPAVYRDDEVWIAA